MRNDDGRGVAETTAGVDVLEPALTHEAKLDRLAEVAVRVGLGLAPGQELVMTAPLDSLPLVRKITEHAYRAGAGVVTTLFTDEESTLLRFRHAPDESFDRVPEWLYTGIANAYRSGAARLAISGSNPALLAGQDPKKISRANLAVSKATRPALDLITRHEINWTIVACATPAWARARVSRMHPRMWPWRGCGMRSSLRLALTFQTRWRTGASTMPLCKGVLDS